LLCALFFYLPLNETNQKSSTDISISTETDIEIHTVVGTVDNEKKENEINNITLVLSNKQPEKNPVKNLSYEIRSDTHTKVDKFKQDNIEDWGESNNVLNNSKKYRVKIDITDDKMDKPLKSGDEVVIIVTNIDMKPEKAQLRVPDSLIDREVVLLYSHVGTYE
jgi:hypothetical protein